MGMQGGQGMNKNLEIPWSIEETILNMKDIKCLLMLMVATENHNGKGTQDAKEIGFDFDRAINALGKQVPIKPILIQGEETECECGCGMRYWRKGGIKYCIECGQKIDWSVEE